MTALVIPFPTRPLDVQEIATRMWELVMLGERDTEPYRTLEREFEARGRRVA